MIISHKYRFIFIKTKKTAGTSIEVFLSILCGDNDVVTPIRPPVEPHRARHYRGYFNPFVGLLEGGLDDQLPYRELLRGRKFYNHIPARRVRRLIEPSIWKSYFKFCVERNPWDKTVSDYFFQAARRKDVYRFEKYLGEGRFPFNYPLYTGFGGEGVIVDRVIRYENLNQELGEVFRPLGIPFGGSLDARAKSEYRTDRRPYQEFFSYDQRVVIERAFRDELDLHGYTF